MAGCAAVTAAAFPSGLVTFVLTDIEGSTRLFRQPPDGHALPLDRGVELADDVFNQVQAE